MLLDVWNRKIGLYNEQTNIFEHPDICSVYGGPDKILKEFISAASQVFTKDPDAKFSLEARKFITNLLSDSSFNHIGNRAEAARVKADAETFVGINIRGNPRQVVEYLHKVFGVSQPGLSSEALPANNTPAGPGLSGA